MIVVHNRDQPKIYKKKPLIERTIAGLMGHLEKRTILFDNNNVQPSNIKLKGNRRHGFWHMALTTHFSIIIIIIHIITSSDDIQPSTVVSDQ